ncbi:MAG: fibronectin type III domain-containing protein [Bryobacteraceae bacterium]
MLSRILLLFCFVVSAGAQPNIIHGPVVDAITYSSVRITWVTDAEATTFIRYGLTSSYDATTTGVKDVRIHSWYLSGLAPSTVYHYQVCSATEAEICSADQTLTTAEAPPGAPAGPEPPRQYVDTSMPSGAYGDPFRIEPDCSNLHSVFESIAALNDELNYEIRIPAGTECRGQFTFPHRPNHKGWIVVRSDGTDSGFVEEGTRVTEEFRPRMAMFRTDALPASRLTLNSLPTPCSPGTLFWATNSPGMALFVCKPQGASNGAKPITGISSESDSVTVTAPGHGYATGNVVRLSGTKMGIDNSWRITVIDENSFTLNGARAKGSFPGEATVTRNDAWTQVSHTTGTELPQECYVNDWFFKTDVSPNTEAAYWCTSPNQWTNVRAINTSSGTNYAAIQFAPNARRYRFIGIEVTHNPVPDTPPSEWSWRNYRQGMIGSLVMTRESNSHIFFDRCDIHGLDYPSRVGQGISLDGSNVAVIDSRIHKITRWQEKPDGGNLEAIAINVANGPGPGKIQNNLLEAIGITVFFPDASYNTRPPADYVFRRNHFSHPDKYLAGSPENESRKNYKNRHLFELKRGRRMLIEGNIFDGNWADHNQGAMVMLSVRPGPVSAKTIKKIENGTVTVDSGSDPFQAGTLVYIYGSGAANHDGIRRIASVESATKFTIENPPMGSGETGRVVAVASDVQISDIDIRSNIFRNGPNLLWITGHQDSGGAGGTMNTKTTQRIRLLNNLIYGMDARSASAGGRVSPVGQVRNGRSGITVWASSGMEDLIVKNNTIYNFKGNLPSLLAFDSNHSGAHAGLEVRNNIFTSARNIIAQISGNSFGFEALNKQWTAHPNSQWVVTNNVFCCDAAAGSRSPYRNVYVDSELAIGFMNIFLADFRLIDISSFKAGSRCYDNEGDCTTDGSDPGVNMSVLEEALGQRPPF